MFAVVHANSLKKYFIVRPKWIMDFGEAKAKNYSFSRKTSRLIYFTTNADAYDENNVPSKNVVPNFDVGLVEADPQTEEFVFRGQLVETFGMYS